MKFKATSTIVLSLLLMLTSCSSDDGIEKDELKPTISISYNESFPQACAQLEKGRTYTFRARATDNQALASYSLDIHHNFDHHTHDDQEEDCEKSPKKEALQPFIYMENFSIEPGLKVFEIVISLKIPETIDKGDYHCAFSVTDVTGWQSRTSVDIEITD